jgi:hypothetical protein
MKKYKYTEDFPTPNDGKHYSIEEDDFIRREYGNSPTKEIAEALGRRTGGVKCRARSLGLTYYDEPDEVVPEGMKYCRTCKTIQPLDNFCNHTAHSKDGKNSVCRSCSAAKKRERWQEEKAKKILSSAMMEEEQMKAIMAELYSQKFTCRICGKEKSGSDFSFLKTTMKLETRCKVCKQENNLKNKVKRIKNGSDW